MAAGNQTLGTEIRGQLKCTPTICPETGKATNHSGDIEGHPQHDPASLPDKSIIKGAKL